MLRRWKDRRQNCPLTHLSPFHLLKQKKLQIGNARTKAKKALNANIGNKAIKEHKAAINEPKSLGPENSHPRVLENLYKWYLKVKKKKSK